MSSARRPVTAKTCLPNGLGPQYNRKMDRDIIGYGAHPPNPHWPNPGGSGPARLAVNFVLNFEEGSEPSIGDGDPASEWGLTEYGGTSPGVIGRDLAAEGMFAYGSRVGFWRILRLFAARDLPMTVFGCALALERNPPAAAAIKAAGHDLCCHGWRWEKHFELSEDVERERIARAIASLQHTMGERPLGWYCRSGPGVNTRRLLVEEGGFLYDSDDYSDDLPFFVEVSGRKHLVLPYSFDTNDMHYHQGFHRFVTARDFTEYTSDAFDTLWAEGERSPKMMSIGLHLRMIGRPGRMKALETILQHLVDSNAEWIATREQIAQHWIAEAPA